MNTWWLILPAFVIMDLLLGDPDKPFHPIRWMGRAIEILEPVFRKRINGDQMAGTLFVMTLVTGTWFLTFGILSFARGVTHEFAVVVEIILLFYSLSIHSLILSGMNVYANLKRNQIEQARISVSMIVGRDTKNLDHKGLIRATIETLGENFVDGIVSPLFFAVIGGAPLAMTFKMISTLDSMVGYRNEQYRNFGTAAARLDDLVNWIPARLSLVFIGVGARICGFFQ
jgi:adenosylcobinamide-phosphate synthase